MAAGWTLNYVCFNATLRGGNMDNYSVRVSACRENRGSQYSVRAEICSPREGDNLVAANVIKDANLTRLFSNPKKALDEAFRSVLRKTGGSGKVTLENIEQDPPSWVYLDDNGMVDPKKSNGDERYQGEYKYTPPLDPYLHDKSMSHKLGATYKAEVDYDEDTAHKPVRSVQHAGQDPAHDSLLKGKQVVDEFMRSNGMAPLPPSAPDPDTEGLRGPGESGDPVANQEPDLPVAKPQGY